MSRVLGFFIREDEMSKDHTYAERLELVKKYGKSGKTMTQFSIDNLISVHRLMVYMRDVDAHGDKEAP